MNRPATSPVAGPPVRTDGPSARKIRVLRVIARLNLGGPAYHVSLLSARLDPARYDTVLAIGRVPALEESFEDVAVRYGARLQTVEGLGPDIRPLSDLRAMIALTRLIRRLRPDIVHTHTAKAGVLGRIAVVLARGRRPVVLHTYHGHVLEGYFGPVTNRLYRAIERALARVTDCLIGVSQATVDDLVRLGIAPRERFRVVPLGLDLDQFLDLRQSDGLDFRRTLDVGPDEVLLVYVGRLEPIKRLDVMLRAFARARRAGEPVRLAVVGDGAMRRSLATLAGELGLTHHVHFLGYRRDLEAIVAGADIAVLTSDNEGTPVFLIEAAAGGRPAVATLVGGVPDIVTEDTGALAAPGDEAGLAAGIVRLSGDRALRERMGRNARERVHERYRSSRLLEDVDATYGELMQRRSSSAAATAAGSR
jgi:glycosyltransferase involved in cell wall biosynthesis